MAGGFLLVIAVVVELAAAASGGGGFHGVLTLERAFPVGERAELETIKARDRARHARMLQSSSDGIVDFPVGGISDPYAVGWSAISVTCFSIILLVDAVDSNGIPLNFFDAATSSTVSPITCSDRICASIVHIASAECSTDKSQCGYTFQYGDGSGTAGFYVSDVLYFDSVLGTSLIANSSAPIIFGCSTSLSGDLSKSDRAVDGIFGFGRQGLSVISQLSSLGITPRIFSHCLRGVGNGGGILVLGQILDPRIVYTPLVPSQYNIAVNGQLLPIDQAVFTTSGNQGTIIDSGTTLAYLVEGAYEPLISAITNVVSPSVRSISSRGNQCYLLTTSVGEMFPTVALNFAGGASMVLRPVDYLVHMGYADGAAMWCMGFIKVPNKGTTILGDLVLKDKIFVYDLAHQRIGWADYDCKFFVGERILNFR
ncbi:hypothetical protein CASFOL_009362 [Castilleja foliolosa]|uniref:Peptidase A1 domain-containing protein n=1 Tax=Castilleja foliolosa TaxID=1961234 RepID=A0ABD3DXG2_9LAMI